MAIVYAHRRKDTGKVFYIGIGRSKYRASKKQDRNKYWHNIVNKHGYTIEILYDGLSWDEAVKKEIQLINKYGRIDLKTGCLVNMTRGGDGKPTNEVAYSDYYTKEELKAIIFKFHPRNSLSNNIT